MAQDIDKTKKALVVLINVAEGVDGALADGQLSLSEGISIVVGNIPGAAEVWSNRAELVEELKDLDSAEVAELEAFVAQELDLNNDATELVVEKAVSWVVSTAELGLAIKAAKQSKDVA